jgi:ubiquinone/menaquinone biosynthesis C-methylase UbiE
LTVSLDPAVLNLLRCPVTGSALRLEPDALATLDGTRRYRFTPSGIPLFGDAWLSADGVVQRDHYDALSPKYLANLDLPHTREYVTFLDAALRAALPQGSLGVVAEICCGTGEGLKLLGRRAALGIGVDVSTRMLEAAAADRGEGRAFAQGDATRLPLASAGFDTVVIIGGIHHVNNRAALFAEVARILKPDGLFLWREPVDDFFVWRAIRSVVYRTASSLQADTEHPLRYRATAKALGQAGFRLDRWRTYGFAGYCLFMNSDVLPINRLWKHVPAIRALTRAAARLDGWTLRAPGLGHAGLIAIGAATKVRA